VASGILPDVEGGIVPPGIDELNINDWQNDQPPDQANMVLSAGLEARLYGRQGCLPPRPIQLRDSGLRFRLRKQG
jgi:hypothetical protein